MQKQPRKGRAKNDKATTPARPDADSAEPLRLTGRRHAFGTMLAWRGRARPGVVGFDLYAWTLTPDGHKPTRLNEEILPLSGYWNDPDPDALLLEADDPFGAFLKKPSAAPLEQVPIWHLQAWIELLSEGRNPAVHWQHDSAPPIRIESGKYFLIDRFSNNRQGDPTVMATRTWTPELDRERDERIRRALEEIRRRGLVTGFPGDATLEELERHLRGGVRGDRGEIGENEGETWPEPPPNPDTGKGMSVLTLNGNTVLDADFEQLVALLLHELVHAAQHLGFAPPGELKNRAIDKINRELEAYSLIWDKIQDGTLTLTPGLQAREAFEATQAIVHLQRRFAEVVMLLEQAPTNAQKAAIRAMRARIRALLLRYQQFLATVPAGPLAALITMGPNGQVMNAKQLVDYLLTNTFN